MPTVLLIDVPGARALGLEERLGVDGCLVRRATGWPAESFDATEVDVVLAHTANPAALALALRRLSRAPLVLVTDAAPTDRVAALTCGADVCLADTEPEPVVEAHVVSLLRRWQPRVRHQLETVQVGELFLDPPGRRAQVAGEDLELRPREFDLLVALARSTGRAFRRHELLDQVWGPRFSGGVNTVDVHISWLRQKLPVAARVRITTLRGVGYRLDELSPLPAAMPLADQAPASAGPGLIDGSNLPANGAAPSAITPAVTTVPPPDGTEPAPDSPRPILDNPEPARESPEPTPAG